MKTELTVNPPTDNAVLTIFEGKALDPLHPLPLKITGNIKAVAAYLKQKLVTNFDGLQKPTKELAVIIVDEQAMTISLRLDPNNPHGTEVTGKLEFTKELQSFYINDNKQFTREELAKFLRFNRRFFADAEENTKLVSALQSLKLTGNTELQQASDTRGNKTNVFVKSIESGNLPVFFILTVPIFKGFPPASFRVEICFNTTEQSVMFWLESVELIEAIENGKKAIFESELVDYTDFVIIHK